MAISKLVKATAVALLCGLYLYGLSAMGLVTPDEPRYADIGRAMARTGDWVTPRLFGVPWYEKPALLYWMTGLGTLAGLGPEWAPRLPVALLSLSFLLFFWWRVKLEWNSQTAGYATAILATTAGWLGYSHVGVTDIPVSVFVSMALLLALPWVERQDRRLLPISAACLGLAVLAKGLVPFVFFAPVAVFGWRRVLDWFRPGPLAAFCLVALPWYIVCSWRSGGEFLRVFFLEHHLGRFGTPALQHVQPWWFYLPALLLLLFPWLPLVVTLVIAHRLRNAKSKLLASSVLFGLFVFSVSLNKLPGYVLPCLPPLAILFGEGIAVATNWKTPLAVTAGLCGLLPLASRVLPQALAHGLRAASVPWAWSAFVLAGLLAGAIAVQFSRPTAFATVAAISAGSFLALQVVSFPKIDLAASARPIWLEFHPNCLGKVTRSLAYGLQYYAGRPLPECDLVDQTNPRVVR